MGTCVLSSAAGPVSRLLAVMAGATLFLLFAAERVSAELVQACVSRVGSLRVVAQEAECRAWERPQQLGKPEPLFRLYAADSLVGVPFQIPGNLDSWVDPRTTSYNEELGLDLYYPGAVYPWTAIFWYSEPDCLGQAGVTSPGTLVGPMWVEGGQYDTRLPRFYVSGGEPFAPRSYRRYGHSGFCVNDSGWSHKFPITPFEGELPTNIGFGSSHLVPSWEEPFDPAPGEVVEACVHRRHGRFRVVADGAACRPRETPRTLDVGECPRCEATIGLHACVNRRGRLRVPADQHDCRRGETPLTLSTPDPPRFLHDAAGNVVGTPLFGGPVEDRSYLSGGMRPWYAGDIFNEELGLLFRSEHLGGDLDPGEIFFDGIGFTELDCQGEPLIGYWPGIGGPDIDIMVGPVEADGESVPGLPDFFVLRGDRQHDRSAKVPVRSKLRYWTDRFWGPPECTNDIIVDPDSNEDWQEGWVLEPLEGELPFPWPIDLSTTYVAPAAKK